MAQREAGAIIVNYLATGAFATLQDYTILMPGVPMNPSNILSIAAQNGGQPADLSFLAYLDIWIIGGLVMLAVVVVVGKLIWSRLTRRDDDDRYYDYYDDNYYDDEYVLDDDLDDQRPGKV